MLNGKRVLVAGGAGAVGEGIVRVCLEEGAEVVVPSRTQDKLDRFLEAIPEGNRDRLTTLVGEIGQETGARQLRDEIRRSKGQLDAVVASLGGWWQGPRLIETPLEQWQKVLTDNLTSHVVAAKTFLPVLGRRPGTSYLFINGGAALTPIPHSGPISVAAAAQLMLKDVLVAELPSLSVRINTLVIESFVVTREHRAGQAGWLTSEDVGDYVAYLISPRAAAIRGQTIRFKRRDDIPG